MFTDKALRPWSSFSDNLGSSTYLIRVRIPVYDHVVLTLTTSRKIIRDQLVSSQVYYKIMFFLRLQVQSDLCLGRADLWSLSDGVTFKPNLAINVIMFWTIKGQLSAHRTDIFTPFSL
jgi:hypothetical protein